VTGCHAGSRIIIQASVFIQYSGSKRLRNRFDLIRLSLRAG
jgi:hypothetical protein